MEERPKSQVPTGQGATTRFGNVFLLANLSLPSFPHRFPFNITAELMNLRRKTAGEVLRYLQASSHTVQYIAVSACASPSFPIPSHVDSHCFSACAAQEICHGCRDGKRS